VLDGSGVKCADWTRCDTGSRSSSFDLSSDFIIVGAGVAGAALAAVLGRQGRRVIFVDPR
jgi:NADPH-dependent 2,4-dienoyl-CoA reductase/sulfur reductase-like enzyme